MQTRLAKNLAVGMTLERPNGFRVKVKSVTNASKSFVIVQTDGGRFVYRKTDIVSAEY